MESHDVVIIGAGPAGIAAAIQLRRYDITPLVFEQEEIGGLLRNAYRVENYPGFPEGISGAELVARMKEQLGRSEIAVCRERVLALDYRDERFVLGTAGRRLTCNTVVVASGTEPRKIPDLAIPDGIMRRVFYQAYPIRNVRYKKVAVIGAGDAAFDYALSLSQHNEVIVLSRHAEAGCNQRLWEAATGSLHISFMRNVEVRKVIGLAGKLLLSCGHLDRTDVTPVRVDYLLIAVGRRPATLFFTRALAEQSAYLALAEKLYMAGDVKNGLYRQASISVGNGVEAAMRIAAHMGV
jgi:thioredoxin reductase (NADPH)